MEPSYYHFPVEVIVRKWITITSGTRTRSNHATSAGHALVTGSLIFLLFVGPGGRAWQHPTCRALEPRAYGEQLRCTMRSKTALLGAGLGGGKTGWAPIADLPKVRKCLGKDSRTATAQPHSHNSRCRTKALIWELLRRHGGSTSPARWAGLHATAAYRCPHLLGAGDPCFRTLLPVVSRGG